MSLASGRCHYHPERAGLGICVECRNVICTECTTQFEGINRCATCLGARLQKARAPRRVGEWSFTALASALVSLALLFGTFYGLARLAAR